MDTFSQRSSYLAIGLLACGVGAQSLNMTQLTHLSRTPCTTGDVWGMGEHHMLLARRPQGFDVIDASDPRNPVSNNVLPPGYPASSRSYGVGDIKSDDRFIYATNEASGGGVFIYDTQPNGFMNPVLVHHLQHNRVSSGVHNCWIDGDYLYCVSNGTRTIEVFDVANKSSPTWLSTLGNGISSVWAHDIITKGTRAYCSLLTGGIAIYDVANPASPQLLGSQNYSNSFTHNMWPTEDERFLYTTDENVVGGVGGSVRIWDISNLSNIHQVGNYKIGSTDSVVHNVHVVGDYLLTAWYKEGVRVASIRNDPTKPVEIAWFDTYAAAGTGCFGSFSFAGCWGVYPFTRFKLFVSDLDGGGYIFALDTVSHTFAAPVSVQRGSPLNTTLQYTSHASTDLTAFGVTILSLSGGEC